jgi:transcriptional regulator with XRE-family HTH domain
LTKILEALRQCGRDWFIEGWGNNDQAPLGALDQLDKAGVRRYCKSSLKIDHACFPPLSLAVDARIDRSYVSRLERGLENPTVAVLDRLAIALNARIAEFFIAPAPGEPVPKPLPGGRRPSR